MKINTKKFDAINTEIKDTQNTKFGKIEIYSLNDYPDLYNMQLRRNNFTYWSNNGGDTYKLLIEDSMYKAVPELYTTEVNASWLQFYQEIAAERKKWFLKTLLPIAIGVLILLGISMFLVPEKAQMPVNIVILVGFLALNMFINSKVNKINLAKKNEAITRIAEHFGEAGFEEARLKQQKAIDDFYNAQRTALGIENPVEEEVKEEEKEVKEENK